MATGDLEVLDMGLGCPEAIEELTMSMERSRKGSQEEKAKGGEKAESREEMNIQVQGLAEEEHSPRPEGALDGIGEGAGETKPSRGKTERGKTAAAPKNAPARKKAKAQAQPQGKAQPRTLGITSDELPWGEITLNKCLALASVVAVLSMAFQVFQDVVDGEEEAPEAAPALWAWPGSSTPRDSEPRLPKPKAWAKVSVPAPPPGPKPPVKDRPETAVVEEAPAKEPEAEGQKAEGLASPTSAPKTAEQPVDSPASSKAAKPEKPSWAAKKEEKARNKKGFRDEREGKEGGRGPQLRREEAKEGPCRPWEREHRRSGRREDSRKAREGSRGKREEQRGRERREDRDRFFPKPKHREGKHRD